MMTLSNKCQLKMGDDKIPIHQIVCVDQNGGIGKNGDLPWKLDKEWQHFLDLSLRIKDPEKKYVCWIMGRSSFETHSKAENGLFHHLANLGYPPIIKVVVSKSWQELPKEHSSIALTNQVILCQHWQQVEEAILSLKSQISEAWNIGGPGVYHTQLEHLLAENAITDAKLHLTQIDSSFDCDVFFPMEFIKELRILDSSDVVEENGIRFRYKTFFLSKK